MQQHVTSQRQARLLSDGTLEIDVDMVVGKRNAKQKGSAPKNKQVVKKQPAIAALQNQAKSRQGAKVKMQPDIMMQTFEDNLEQLLPNPKSRSNYIRALHHLRRLNKGKPIRELILPSPESMLRRVVLPHPDGPTSATNSPRWMSSVTLRTTSTPPKAWETP